MGSLRDHPSTKIIKLLMVGDSGVGKTGALASLVKAGYNLRIADMDNGVDILRSLLSGEELDRVDYKTFTDTFVNKNGRLLPKMPLRAWTGLTTALGAWDAFGDITTWNEKDVFVLDSMTLAGMAALRQVLAINARSGQTPWQSDYNEAQVMLETLLMTLYDDAVKCNIVVNTHVTMIENKTTQVERGYAATVGKALSKKVGRYFNTIVQVHSKVVGPNVTREIITNPTQGVELKTSNPLKVKPSYPLATGLANLFEDIRSSVDQPK